ncbi:cytochrome c oxidase, subunit VIb [Pelagophyceae sp. CCMP2097]|nr:cytochrome c oxidase, subunit VIb [Pelagophyceae sp. CCMP2097]
MSGLTSNIKTTPVDKRFPSTNQANHCWNRYNEWVMCLKKTDGDEDACKVMRQFAMSICPDDWSKKWDEEREEGNFPGIQYGGGH